MLLADGQNRFILRAMNLNLGSPYRRSALALTCALGVFTLSSLAAAGDRPFRPPAVPLVTSDPYLSIWSEADHLYDDTPRHWTHREHSLVSLLRVGC